MNTIIRKAKLSDLETMIRIESESFPTFQQSKRESIKNSIKSSEQEVFLLENSDNQQALGSMILVRYKKTLRIYSIAVLKEFQKHGLGSLLLNHAFKVAQQFQMEKISLEVQSKNQTLINWYLSKGFQLREELLDYYIDGENAFRMELKLEVKGEKSQRNIIVINKPYHFAFESVNAKLISVKEYINDPSYQSNSDLRVFNLCSSYKYQSYGYYVSLLAAARNQRAIPSSLTIGDFKLMNVIRSVTAELEELIADTLKRVESNSFELHVYFGQSVARGFGRLAMKLFQLIEAPLFKVQFVRSGNWIIKSVKVLNLSRIPESELEHIRAFAKKYFDKKRFTQYKTTSYKYDLAILINPEEKTPPSCPKALQKIKMAANKRGIYTDFITTADFDKINEYDALFIRETTGVNNDTYEFSRMAYAEGLVVIDEPWSILKCSNKIYQNEVFRTNKILTPETTVLTKNHFNKKMLEQLNYPLVLKQPDSAFSLGVTKVESQEETLAALEQLFKLSDMVICQAFLPSDYDWRVGVLDNQALFACKYYMSKGHWQIYNWKSTEEDNSGDFDCIPISEVPPVILKTALKAASFFGDGLYGVDLKMIDNKVYVIEVNDNPNIDAGVEDAYLKDTLYDQLIASIYRRIEVSKNIISKE